MEFKKSNDIILIDLQDNVATAATDLECGKILDISIKGKINSIKLQNNIPRGHKIALIDLQAGTKVIKYGEIIGEVSQNIKAGEHVHTHNLKSLRGGV